MVFCSLEGKDKLEISRICAATRSINYIVLYLKTQQKYFILLMVNCLFPDVNMCL